MTVPTDAWRNASPCGEFPSRNRPDWRWLYAPVRQSWPRLFVEYAYVYDREENTISIVPSPSRSATSGVALTMSRPGNCWSRLPLASRTYRLPSLLPNRVSSLPSRFTSAAAGPEEIGGPVANGQRGGETA